jgi:hypothetical protein
MGRETVFEVIRSSVGTLAAADQRETLRQCIEALINVDSWWLGESLGQNETTSA